MNVLPPHGLVDWVLSPGNLLTAVGVVIGVAIALLALWNLIGGRNSETAAATTARNARRIEKVTSRWQLVLLGTAAFLLSIASGYRVWEGMTNFTGEKTLSLMVTFGLQGVMLIVAWLIGESFANGMSRRLPDGRRASTMFDALIGILLAVAVVAAVFYWLLYHSGAIGITKSGDVVPVDWSRFADISAYSALALIVLGVLAFNFSRGGELSLPYVQSARIVVKNAVLWVMLLACMSAAVFFSFDSLFTSIFPKDERTRAAQLRAQNIVGGMVADIGTTIESRRQTEVQTLFNPKSDNGWSKYDDHLSKLAAQSQGAQREIETYFNSQIEERNRAIKQQQERITSAQSGSAGLIVKKSTLTDELSRLKGERPSLAADHAEKKTELDNRAKGVDAKRVEAQAEDRGAEGTLKQGKGPVYRQLTTDLTRLQDAYKIQEERVRDSQRRLATTDTRIAQLERELAAVDGDIAKLKGEAETAQQRIKLTQDTSSGDSQPRIDPSRMQPAFEKARQEFRQEPTRDRLGQLHQQCSQLYAAIISAPAIRDRVRGIDCDPKQANEAAAVMFALNDGLKIFAGTCVGGEKLEAQKTTDDLYSFARKCLADSGLPAKETDELRAKINFLELTRDDKAHPFVASLNAFQDGNRLAYLALGIAIIMESLVFMSGLFGANAVRSPLSDVPSTKARSGRQLEAIMENALLPDTFENARVVLNAMRPMTTRDGFSARVTVRESDPHAADIRRVLNAAATIGAVRHNEGYEEVYEVRSELFEFLSVVAKKAFESNEDHARMAELRKVIAVALQPQTGRHADLVLHHCRPISEKNGFSAEIYLSRMSGDDAFVVQKVLNAGATMSYVQLDERADQDERYYVHKQLYKTLLLIAAAAQRVGQLGGPEREDAIEGGSLNSRRPALRGAAGTPALTNSPALAESEEAEDAIRDYFWRCFIEALQIDPQLASSSLNVGEISDAATATWDALQQHGRSNSRLAQLLRQHQRRQDELLSSVSGELGREIGVSRRKHDILDEVYQTVRRYLPALMVFPQNGLLASVISGIERAAQTDDGLAAGEQALKDRLENLREDIGNLDLARASDWIRMKELIESGMSLDQPNIVVKWHGRRQRR